VLHAALEKVEDAGSKASLQTTLAATKLLEDHSVRLEGDVSWQEVHLQFEFDKPTNVEEIRLELLSVDSPTGPQFGRGGDELMLFDVKPSIEDQTGKSTSIDFASCTYLQNPSDETTGNCIDQLSDTGWKVGSVRLTDQKAPRHGLEPTANLDSGDWI